MTDLLTVEDQMGHEVNVPVPPKRIISLVPSQTEFLLDIGVKVVGRTKFCIHPHEEVQGISVIGGTKKFHFDKIAVLEPDLIIGNKEENYEEGIEKLREDFPVWMSDICTLEDSYDMMKSIGEICDKQEASAKLVSACRSSLNRVKGAFSGKVIYLIWKNPWMAAGRNTFIDHLLQFLGFENLVIDERYPVLTEERISALNPDRILFSSEPYPFKNTHVLEARSKWPMADCRLVDGELHSWYGSRLKNWADYS